MPIISNKKIDTADVLTEQDYNDIRDIEDIKKRVLSYIEIPTLIEKISEFINNSEFIEFKNERSKKFIDKRRPIFYISIDRDKAYNSEKYKVEKIFNSQEEEAKYFTNIIGQEIVELTTTYINDCLKADPELDSYVMSKDIFKNCTKEERYILNGTGIFSTMFGIRLSSDDYSNAIVEMVI